MFGKNSRGMPVHRGHGRGGGGASRGRGMSTNAARGGRGKFQKHSMNSGLSTGREFYDDKPKKGMKPPNFQEENFYRSDFSFNKNSRSGGLGESRSISSSGDDEKWSQFSDVIVFFGGEEKQVGFKVLSNSFKMSSHGPLSLDIRNTGSCFQARLSCEGVCLAEGVGSDRTEAELNATQQLLAGLRQHNYFIEAKDSYYPKHKKNFPKHVLNVDPSWSHIYKVVCLRNAEVGLFPHRLEGAVHYVSSMHELQQYVTDHCESPSNADLYILGITKPDRKHIYDLCKEVGFLSRPLVGCSDRGVVAFLKENVKDLFQELQKCGGENIKYVLIPPGGSRQEVTIKKEELEYDEEMNYDNRGQGSQRGLMAPPPVGHTSSPAQPGLTHQQQEEIKISPWISQSLIIMEVFNHNSLLESDKEILFCSVRDSPNLEGFIIEKKVDKYTGSITAEALIDKAVVGRAQGTSKFDVRDMAARDALKRLKDHCYFIECKRSYFGYDGELPQFLKQGNTGPSNLYKVVERSQASSEEELSRALRQFKTSKVEDIFFLDDYSQLEKTFIYNMATQMNMNVRLFGKKCVCVFKKKKPNQIVREFKNAGITENEKYKLIIPPMLCEEGKTDIQNSKPGDTKLQNLFDFSKQDIELQQSSSTQDRSRRPVESFSTEDSKPVDPHFQSLFAPKQNVEIHSNSSTQNKKPVDTKLQSLFDFSNESIEAHPNSTKKGLPRAERQGVNYSNKRVHDAGAARVEEGPPSDWKQLKLQHERDTKRQLQNHATLFEKDLESLGQQSENYLNRKIHNLFDTGKDQSGNVRPQARGDSEFRAFADSITDFVGSLKRPLDSSLPYDQMDTISKNNTSLSHTSQSHAYSKRPSNTPWEGSRQSSSSSEYGSRPSNTSSEHGSRLPNTSSYQGSQTSNSRSEYGSREPNTSSTYGSRSLNAGSQPQYESRSSNIHSQHDSSSQYGSRSSHSSLQQGSKSPHSSSQHDSRSPYSSTQFGSKPSDSTFQHDSRSQYGSRSSDRSPDYDTNTRSFSSRDSEMSISAIGRAANKTIKNMFDM